MTWFDNSHGKYIFETYKHKILSKNTFFMNSKINFVTWMTSIAFIALDINIFVSDQRWRNRGKIGRGEICFYSLVKYFFQWNDDKMNLFYTQIISAIENLTNKSTKLQNTNYWFSLKTHIFFIFWISWSKLTIIMERKKMFKQAGQNILLLFLQRFS